MKFFIFLITLLIVTVSPAQVGISTTDPKVTLDVTGEPNVPTKLDGILPPRLTGDELKAKSYGASQNGTIVYVTQPSFSPSGQVIDVTASGLYVFNFNINKWIALVSNFSGQNVFCNNDNPNSATIFDDELPAVTNDSALTQNTQYIYFGLDASIWIWNGTSYVSFVKSTNLNVGQRVSVYKTMANTVPNATDLPATGLIELDGLIRVGLNKVDVNYYKPYIFNLSANPIKVTFTSACKGATIENRYAVQATIAANANQGVDFNDITYWTTTLTETLTVNVILPNGKWYEIEWYAYEVSAVKQIFMSALRKF
ncbi:hypothetical protein [Flavobacterium geliluteum]|uniref:Uncharacterized protein n=1 Tax=Flavobacterium geliluteum TaxID=2816120 RepID=A0A940XAI0_9FLAO|nr:hypothetical protein [Flavobacterium geliluteum]MBP4138922.1 hypothetical protein [Flavobacterium geliluteum]